MSPTYGVVLHRSDYLSLDPHPESPTAEDWRSWVENLNRPTAVDLFCGAGGLSLGLKQAGFEVVAAVDTDDRALATHQANFPGRALKMDLADPRQVDDLERLFSGLAVDVVAGGPPCQPFSKAGRSKIRSLVAAGVRSPVDERRDLWRMFLDLAQRIRPSAVLFENVPDIALWDDSRIVRQMASSLEEIGYSVDYRLVDAWRYGVPQLRQRLILVALSGGRTFDWPTPVDQRVTVRDAISDLPRLGDGIGGRELSYEGPSRGFQESAREGMSDIEESNVWDHMTRPVRDDDREAFALMTSKTRYSDLPEHLRRYRTDIFNDKYKRLDWDDLSRTITAHIAKDGYWYIHPSEHRTLSVREAARLQTFPDQFRFEGTRSHAYSQIGNAVPPALASAISKSVRNAIENRIVEQREVVRKEVVPSSANRQHWFRQRLVDWAADDAAVWRRTGEPWPVLLSTICGARGIGDTLAIKILNIWPAPPDSDDELTDGTRQLLGIDQRANRRVLLAQRSARSIREAGWESREWISAAGLGPAAVRWVEAIGLKRNDLLTTTGILRVADRFAGIPSDTRIQTRLVLARLAGTDHPIETIAAMAGLAVESCTATAPKCGLCPLEPRCHFASYRRDSS